MERYLCLKQQNYHSYSLTLVPIRLVDRYDIMKWRNEQIFHLRQKVPLTKEKQDSYFDTTILRQFKEKQPDQILFSVLSNNELIGYGGLVHIDWESKNAEISLLLKTELQEEYFCKYWIEFLSILKIVAFKDLHFVKIYTYAYDVRPLLPLIFEYAGFKLEGKLKNHHIFNDQIMDVLIHSFTSPYVNLKLRDISIKDMIQLFDWANERETRKNSIQQDNITFESHYSWFTKQISSSNSKIFILSNSNFDNIGQIRFTINENGKWLINYSIDKNYRNLGLGKKIIELGMNQFPKNFDFEAIVENQNIPSQKIFESLDFKLIDSFKKDNRTFLVFNSSIK